MRFVEGHVSDVCPHKLNEEINNKKREENINIIYQ